MEIRSSTSETEKFVTWLNSEVGCTKFDRYDEAAKAWEQVHETESLVSIDFH